MQNETGYPVGEEIFDAGTVSGGVYPCLFSGDGGTGLLADREPDKGSGRPGRHGPYMGPGPGRGVRTAAAVLYENSVQPELWQDVISCWYPQAKQAERLQEGRRVV